ncbi:MAG: pyridoxamine 5'-phosphate oxidase [Actinomycetota bacterium]|nr:pyridoxamine 5'-phosphate oxidase [Actinomycetota bacterium]
MPRRPDMPGLDRDSLADDPLEQFAAWWERAVAEVPLCDAMTLATVDSLGMPDARMVLLKGFGPDGFRFFTNRESAKGKQLATHPDAALVIYWRELDRQVRVRGQVAELKPEESDAYFATRARDSQLGAWASPQSRPLGDRGELEELLREATQRFETGEVPRPPHWGGYLLHPDRIEFWQGQVGRLHDRFAYERVPEEYGGPWRCQRLGP